jgi:outer membrane protein assembly factor BamB
MTKPGTQWQTSVVVVLFTLFGCSRPSIPETAEVVVPAGRAAGQALPAPAFAPSDWPGWRGPNTDGVASGSVPLTWDETTNVVWKTRIPGRGHGSPIIVGDQIYLETADEAAQVQSVLAVDRRRGRLLWQTDLHTGRFETAMHHENTQASSTLASDGERLFAVFLNDRRVWCSALSLDGDELWRTEVGGFRSKFGYSASPTVFQSLVIVAGDHEDGGFVAGLHRGSGDIVWRRKRPADASWSSPRVVRLGGVDQLVLCGGQRVISYDPLTGTELWNVAGTAESTVGSAVVSGDLVIVSGGYPGKDTVALRPNGNVAWRVTDKSYVPSLLAAEGFVYMIQDDGGIARCFDAATGKERWKSRIGGNYRTSPLLCDGRIYITDMTGRTTVFAASPEKFEKLAENQLGTEGFASPAVSDGQLFLRIADDSRGGRQEWLYCLGK